MRKEKLNRLLYAALLAALTCVATVLIKVPSPVSGYVNMGDSIVLLSGFLLGPVYGAASAGIGSLFADIFTGYFHYAPATFIVKFLSAFLAAKTYRALGRRKSFWSLILSGLSGEWIVVLGYFSYCALILGRGASAALGIPGNIVQAVFGIIVSSLLYSGLRKVSYFKDVL